MSRVVARLSAAGGQVLELRHGDLTAEEVDAIVNAANTHLQHGGGVAGAIVSRGGRVIQQESDRIGRVPVGQVAVTSAGSLPAKHVIHAVGPRMGEGDEDRKLASAVSHALAAAEERGLRSIALPAISSGIFGFPKDRCAAILVAEAERFCAERPDSVLREIRFTLIDQPTVEVFRAEFARRGAEAVEPPESPA
ncbi:MAG: macro domain-containing protein [Armatimonadota bacterium]